MVSSVLTLDEKLDLSWTTIFEPANGGRIPNGFYLVLNDGPKPQDNDRNEIAILYADATEPQGRVSAYVYNSALRFSSWQDPSGFITSFPDAVVSTALDPGTPLPQGGSLSSGGVRFDVSLNVDPINNGFSAGPNWVGVFFHDTIGIWSQFTSGSQFGFDPDGQITGYRFDSGKTSYDRADRTTVPVSGPIPEPSAPLLFAAGALVVGYATMRRSRQSIGRA